jgi:ankyrin repeat protein
MSQSISTPETAATAITKDLEICDPVINIEDSHFQLPIRRRPSISISNDEDSEAQQSIATEDMNSEATKETDSDSSQMIFTPEAGLSEDDDVELDIMEEKVTGSDDLLNQGDPTFHEAVAGGFVDLVKSCIGQGVDVDLKTKDGETPLIIAILEAQLGMASTLLECGANVHRRANGMPSIIYAAMKGAPAPPFLRLLKDWGANPSTIHGPHRYNALHWAASAGNTAAVDFLVSIGMNLEQPCSQGRTPLLIAAANGKTAVTKLLLAKGAEAKHRSHNGGTAVAWAACHGHVGTVAYLLKEGLDVEVPDSSGISKYQSSACLFIPANTSSPRRRSYVYILNALKLFLNLLIMYHRPIVGSEQFGLHRGRGAVDSEGCNHQLDKQSAETLYPSHDRCGCWPRRCGTNPNRSWRRPDHYKRRRQYCTRNCDSWKSCRNCWSFARSAGRR